MARADRLGKDKWLEHGELHPLFQKTEEELREHGSKILKEAEEQKTKQGSWWV
jgi:hypothetical protein